MSKIYGFDEDGLRRIREVTRRSERTPRTGAQQRRQAPVIGGAGELRLAMTTVAHDRCFVEECELLTWTEEGLLEQTGENVLVLNLFADIGAGVIGIIGRIQGRWVMVAFPCDDENCDILVEDE
jgi:hypothetical protein